MSAAHAVWHPDSVEGGSTLPEDPPGDFSTIGAVFADAGRRAGGVVVNRRKVYLPGVLRKEDE